MSQPKRCWWCGDKPDYVAYHDEEWGVPEGNDHRLYEKLCLEAFQSGLSWLTILRKRENFRAAFEGFDFEKVARFGERDIQRLLGDAGIVRHRGKIEAAISNARAACDLVQAEGSLGGFLWRFEPPKSERPRNFRQETVETLTTSPAAKAMAKELKKRGFRFVGPTTAYAFHQAMGLVNDHVTGCFRRREVEGLRANFSRP